MKIVTPSAARWTRVTGASRLTALRLFLAGASLMSLLLAAGAGLKWN